MAKYLSSLLAADHFIMKTDNHCSFILYVSVQFSGSVMSDSLQAQESQHARPPCPSPTPGVYSDSCPLSWWCHVTISSFVVPFSHPLSFPEWGSFPMSQFFASGGQSIGDSASPSVLPRNIQDWLALELTGWISLQSKGVYTTDKMLCGGRWRKVIWLKIAWS